MMRRATVFCLLALPCLALAHHSAAMFDKNVVVDTEATVREFQWTNPHVWIEIDVTGDDGKTVGWSIEGGGTNSLFRDGWRRDTFVPGQVIRIRFNPMKDGSAAGGFVGVRFEDGHTLGRWD